MTTFLELDLTPNRGDCLSMLGVAYEVGAILNKEVRYPKINYQEVKDNIEDYLSLKVETENCPLYIAKMVRDVEIKESSQFIKSALIKLEFVQLIMLLILQTMYYLNLVNHYMLLIMKS